MVGPRCLRTLRHSSTNSERTLLARLSPPALFHDDANHHAYRLSQPLRATRVFRREKGVDGWVRLELSNDPCQGGPVVMNLGLLHTALAPKVVEEGEHVVKRLLSVVKHVSERSSLSILEEFLSGKAYNTWHRRCPFHGGKYGDFLLVSTSLARPKRRGTSAGTQGTERQVAL
jgi:hypothetical protein